MRAIESVRLLLTRSRQSTTHRRSGFQARSVADRAAMSFVAAGKPLLRRRAAHVFLGRSWPEAAIGAFRFRKAAPAPKQIFDDAP